ncbi:MAG TPA: LpxL/LpxP family Kdo(2)-lipid IV(A) lauroyl/palmitoleoyl acyltransferase [Candidatus Competibacteraceae bacterium]|nr:LpxL/LpxP family Kdo(2)-lipid IV(A) lauroyl/palmitoleoyl acyltransferase [Candidatus Competibacteraceae bacterium]
MEDAITLRHYAAPRYWPTWLGMVTMRLMAALPLAWQLRLGRWMGLLSLRVAPRRRRIADTNLRLCFPHLNSGQRRHLLREHFAALGIGMFETAAAWWAPDAALRGRVEIVGLEHLEQASASGKGIILLTGHFTCLELGARFITWHLDFHAMYRPHKNPLYEALMRRCREQQSRLPPLPRDELRATLRALRQGRAIWYAPDQNYGGTQSVFVPFFGIPTLTITATARLAQLGEALVLPYWPQRLADGRYRVIIQPPLSDFPSGEAQADARRINALLEDAIRQAPEQYLWVHRRFKTRPPGEPRIY